MSFSSSSMAAWLGPVKGGHVGIFLNQPEQNTPLQAVNGHCAM